MHSVECFEFSEVAGGIVVFWDSRVLQLNDVKEGSFSISHQLKSCDNHFYWCFTSMYGSTVDTEREGLWNELRVVNGLVGGW